MDDLEDTFQNVDQIENGVDKTNSHQRVESLLSSGLTFPEGIAIDWISRNIYYTGDWCGISSIVMMIKGIAKDFYIDLKQTDPGRDLIEVASLEDGTRRRLLAEDQVTMMMVIIMTMMMMMMLMVIMVTIYDGDENGGDNSSPTF